jgi:hypothetical protein
MSINYLGIILGVALNIALARLWFGILFRDLWRSLTNRTSTEKPDRLQMMVSLLFALMLSLGVNTLVSLFAINTLAWGLFVGLVLGVLFVVPIVLGEWIWDKKNFELVALNTGFYLVYLVLTFFIFILV